MCCAYRGDANERWLAPTPWLWCPLALSTPDLGDSWHNPKEQDDSFIRIPGFPSWAQAPKAAPQHPNPQSGEAHVFLYLNTHRRSTAPSKNAPLKSHKSQAHQGWERPQGWVQPFPWHCQVHQTMSLSTPSGCFLSTPRDADHSTALGSLCHCLSTLPVKKFLLIFHLDLPWCNLYVGGFKVKIRCRNSVKDRKSFWSWCGEIPWMRWIPTQITVGRRMENKSYKEGLHPQNCHSPPFHLATHPQTQPGIVENLRSSDNMKTSV